MVRPFPPTIPLERRSWEFCSFLLRIIVCVVVAGSGQEEGYLDAHLRLTFRAFLCPNHIRHCPCVTCSFRVFARLVCLLELWQWLLHACRKVAYPTKFSTPHLEVTVLAIPDFVMINESESWTILIFCFPHLKFGFLTSLQQFVIF